MKKHRSLLLGLVTFAMLLSGCHGVPKKDESNPTDNPYHIDDAKMIRILSSWNPNVEIKNDPTYEPTFVEETAVPKGQGTKLSSSLLDLPIDSVLYVEFTEKKKEELEKEQITPAKAYQGIVEEIEHDRTIYGITNNNYINVTDIAGIPQDFAIDYQGDYITMQFSKESFFYGAVYTVELIEEAGLMFTGKDESIQRLTVEIEDDPTEAKTYDIIDTKENVPTLDMQYVTKEDVDENKLFSFVYSGTLPELAQGDLFQVKKDAEKEDITDFYGLFESKEMVGEGLWKVYYQEPQGEDIYQDLHKKGIAPIDLTNTHVIVTKKIIQDQFRYSTTARGFVNFFAKYGETTNENVIRGILDSIKISLTYNYYNNKLTFGFSVSVSKIHLTDNLYMTLKYGYQKVTVYNIDFDVGLKKKWIVPVGISYKIKCVEDITESHYFQIIVDYVKEEKEKSDEEVKDDLASELNNAKAGNENFFSKLKNSAEAKAQTEGNKTTIPLFEIPIPIVEPLVFEIKLEFIFELTIEAMFMVKKQWSSNRVVFNFSNKDDDGSDTHQDIEGTSYWDFYFMGMAEVKVALRLTGALYFRGTYKYLHVEVYAEFYILAGVQGALAATFATETKGEEFSGNFSIDFYVLMGAKVGFDVVIAIFDYGKSLDLFKTYIFRLYYSNEIEHYTDDAVTQITLNKTVANIDEFNILKFRCWDGVSMIMKDVVYQAGAVQNLIESWIGDLSFPIFTFTVEDQYKDLIEVDSDGTIRVKDGTPADFNARFTIKVNKIMGGLLADRPISVHFEAPDANHVYIDDPDLGTSLDLGRFRPGAKIVLPEAPKRDGWRFLDYLYNNVKYKGLDEFTMGEEEVHFVVEWHKIIYYNVYFYDGHNNLIYTDRVEEYTAATAPSPEIRDQFMDGYEFVGWDKKFDVVTTNLLVRGIYVKVGD